MTTYTRRENARRAAVAAGLPKERVLISIHKSGNEVRFGWKEGRLPTIQKVTTKPTLAHVSKGLAEERNRVKRPKTGGLCAAVWSWLDSNPGATVKEIKSVAPAKNWNLNNAICEFYRWRKFNGFTGSTLAI